MRRLTNGFCVTAAGGRGRSFMYSLTGRGPRPNLYARRSVWNRLILAPWSGTYYDKVQTW